MSRPLSDVLGFDAEWPCCEACMDCGAFRCTCERCEGCGAPEPQCTCALCDECGTHPTEPCAPTCGLGADCAAA
jgi:hypothetical protein